MRIWVDADAMPVKVKEILFKAAQREGVPLVLVANVPLKHPDSPLLSSVVVEDGFNVADDWIVEQVTPGDLVVTADIPLAGRVVDCGATALDPRGTLYTEDNVKARLATRNLLDELRGAELITGGGPPPFTKKDVHAFATALQAYLVRHRRGLGPTKG
ncbi:MAG: YaiI/YqxD family protein [Vulcanimicrobiota bacterium]